MSQGVQGSRKVLKEGGAESEGSFKFLKGADDLVLAKRAQNPTPRGAQFCPNS